MEERKVIPSKRKIEFMDWEWGVFFHFGIRTFYEGHTDWDGRPMDASGFCPEALDCEQWIRTVSEAGGKYAVLVCKHHDGFANWPSAYTEYSVKNTPWKDGKGDVVREYVDACRKYGIKVGLYYSPAEAQQVERTDEEYEKYFIDQIGELLTGYGKIDYLWFDGCGSENHSFHKERVIAAIRGMQPEILIFNMWDPDTRWVGNEAGIVPYPNFNVVDSLGISVRTDKKENLENLVYMPGECDCRMREENWFYSDSDEETVKSVDELMGLYYYSVGRGANLLLNIGPDRRGLLPEKDCRQLLAFGEEIHRRFDRPLKGRFIRKEEKYFIEFPEVCLVNHVILKENLLTGKEISEFKIYGYGYPCVGPTPLALYQGSTIGHKAICRFPAMRTDRLEIVIPNQMGELSDAMAFYVEP